MNVLFVLNNYPSCGGVQSVTKLLASELQNRGYGIYILSCHQSNKDISTLPHHESNLYYFPSSELFSNTNVQYFHHLLYDLKVNIIINQGVYRNITHFLSKALKNKGYKVISVIHSDPMGEFKNCEYFRKQKDFKSLIKKYLGPFYQLRVKFLYRKRISEAESFSKCFVLLSVSFLDDFKRFVSRKRKIQIIPNGIKIKTSELNELKIFEAKKNTILYLGRMVEPYKRVSRLLYIWKELYKDYPTWQLKLVGDGEDCEYLKQLSCDMQLENIHFEGYHEDVSFFLKEASIICLVSDSEGLPMALIEGMLYGAVPVVYGSSKVFYDMIQDNENGKIVPPFSQEQYVKALRKLMSNSDKCHCMGISAYRKSKQYDITNVVDKWVDLFNNV